MGIDQGVSVFIAPAGKPGLAEGHPALFSRRTMKLLEEPTEFLYERYVRSGVRSSTNTWQAAAYALQSWLDFIDEAFEIDWSMAARDHLFEYRDAYYSAISPRTGTPYSASTIRNRLLVIIDFYFYLSQRNLYSGDLLLEATDRREAFSTIDRDPLPHLRQGRMPSVKASTILPKVRPHTSAVSCFSVFELRKLLEAVGPRASEPEQPPAGSGRDRLIVDLGWAVGLRLDEIHQLTIYQFLGLCPDPNAPAGEQPLKIKGKGKKVRTIAIPNWLVIDAIAYINGARSKAIKAAKPNGKRKSLALLISGADSTRAGAAIGHRRIQQILEEAGRRAGLIENVQRTDPSSRKAHFESKVKLSVHSLRHTYAIFKYWAERRAGNPESWKKIQAQLGHTHLSTTTDTYLQHVEIFSGWEATVDVRAVIGL